MAAATFPRTDMVDVRMVVRDVTRYERRLRMPRALFEFTQGRLANSPDAGVHEEVSGLIMDCFDGDHGNAMECVMEVETFELACAAAAAPDVLVDPGGSSVPPLHPLPSEAVAVGSGLDSQSLEQGEPS